MIITTTRHGRTRRDTRKLIAHLRKEVGQVSRVAAIGNVPLSDADAAMAYMEAMRDGSRADVAYHHVTLSPTIRLDDAQRDEAVQRILKAMGAEDHPYVLWEHDGKARSRTAADQHFHLIVGHVGPDGRALRDSGSFRKLEAVARTLEVDFGETLTHSRRTASVAAELVAMGRQDVAEALPVSSELPHSSMTSTGRARAARQGLDLPAAQEAVRSAWERADGPAAFRTALAEMGFEVAPGRKPGVFIVSAGTAELGALDRIVKERRKDVAKRMEGFDHEPEDPTPAPPAIRNGPDEGAESRVRAVPGSAPGGAKAAAFALASGATGRGAGEPDREAAGHSGDDRARSAPAPSEPRGSPREARFPRFPRLEAALLERALTGFEPTQATKAAATEIKLESLSGRFARFTSAILDRQIGNGLDRLQRLAWDVRDVINDVRLRIRFGQAEQRTPLPEPEPDPSPAPQPPDRLAALRSRIQDARSHKATEPDDDPAPAGFKF